MGAHRVWAVLAGAAMVCAACGGASQTTTQKSSTTAQKLPLSAYLVQGHEETGLPRTGPPTEARTPAQWASGAPNAAAWAKRLAQEGFREGVQVHTGSSQGQGVSTAIVLGSASAAAREQAAQLRDAYLPASSGGAVTRFTVSGVPSAQGYTYPDGHPPDANIVFTEGRCVMLVGDQLSTDVKPPVVAAVRAIWARTHGKPGACTS